MITILMALLALASPASGTDLESMLFAPGVLGETVSSVTRVMGEPEEISFEWVQNTHDPKMKDVRVTLEYAGARVTLYVALCCEKSMLESVLISDRKWMEAFGERWPADAEEAQAAIGPPSEQTAAALIYNIENEVGTDTMTLRLGERGVTAVEWRYWID